MIRLFDVNVLIAIADSSHIFHHTIHRWLAACEDKTWASCPITENGMIRVLSQPAYRGGSRTPAEVVETLRQMRQSRPWRHVFWTEDFSIADKGPIIPERIAGTKQVTDIYLLALALRRQGRLVTFDAGLAWHAVEGATRELIEVPAL